jgi:hypothetical protein
MPVKYNDFTPDSIVQSIIEKFIDRAKMGKEKYGQTLDRSDLPFEDYINHALEEHMDAILYLKKAQQMFKEKDQDGR